MSAVAKCEFCASSVASEQLELCDLGLACQACRDAPNRQFAGRIPKTTFIATMITAIDTLFYADVAGGDMLGMWFAPLAVVMGAVGFFQSLPTAGGIRRKALPLGLAALSVLLSAASAVTAWTGGSVSLSVQLG